MEAAQAAERVHHRKRKRKLQQPREVIRIHISAGGMRRAIPVLEEAKRGFSEGYTENRQREDPAAAGVPPAKFAGGEERNQIGQQTDEMLRGGPGVDRERYPVRPGGAKRGERVGHARAAG